MGSVGEENGHIISKGTEAGDFHPRLGSEWSYREREEHGGGLESKELLQERMWEAPKAMRGWVSLGNSTPG